MDGDVEIIVCKVPLAASKLLKKVPFQSARIPVGWESKNIENTIPPKVVPGNLNMWTHQWGLIPILSRQPKRGGPAAKCIRWSNQHELCFVHGPSLVRPLYREGTR